MGFLFGGIRLVCARWLPFRGLLRLVFGGKGTFVAFFGCPVLGCVAMRSLFCGVVLGGWDIGARGLRVVFVRVWILFAGEF